MSSKGKTPPKQYWEKGHLSIAGSGFLAPYGTGVVLAFKEFAPHIVARKCLGVSSGALVCMTIACGLKIVDMVKFSIEIIGQLRSSPLGTFSPRLDITGILRTYMTTYLPKHAHKMANNRLSVSLTRLKPFKNEVFSDFDSREELIEIMLASCFIPFYMGIIPPKLRGAMYIDGGATNNLPVHDENTITVSAFSGQGCIRPEASTPYWAETVFSPENAVRLVNASLGPCLEDHEKIFREGYENGLQFVRDHDLYACGDCARLPSRPRRGDCRECELLLKRMEDRSIAPVYLQPLREARQAEDALMKANPFRYSCLMKTVNFLMALVYLPIGYGVSLAESAYRRWCS